MSVTLKPWSIGTLIATFAVLVGFAVGQVTASNAGGSASYVSSVQDKAVAKELKKLNKNIGAKYTTDSIMGRLYQIQVNTGYVCREVSGSSLCTTID